MKILILGGTGFVGRNLARHLRAMGQEVVAVGRELCDIFYPISVANCLRKNHSDVIINAAGNKNLLWCETNSNKCEELNSMYPLFLGNACVEWKIPYVYIGSDHAYAEPKTQYGLSKVHAEMMLSAHPNGKRCPHLVVTTGHVYDNDCPWIQWLDSELKAGRKVEAWTDIVARPTYCQNLAAMILDMLNRKVTGTVNCVSRTLVNRAELFRSYANVMGYDSNLIVPCPTPCPSPYHIRKLYCECTYKGEVSVNEIGFGFLQMKLERMKGELKCGK